MTNDLNPLARDAGALAKQLLARGGKRRRTAGLTRKGLQTRARIQLLVACKLALITAAMIIE